MPIRKNRMGIFPFPEIRDNFYKYSGALYLFCNSVAKYLQILLLLHPVQATEWRNLCSLNTLHHILSHIVAKSLTDYQRIAKTKHYPHWNTARFLLPRIPDR